MSIMQNSQRCYGIPRERICKEAGRCYQQPFEQDNRPTATTKRTPLRAVNTMSAPMDFGCKANPLFCPLPQPPSLSTYLEQQPFPIGTPPGFIPPLPFISPTHHPTSERSNSIGPQLRSLQPPQLSTHQSQTQQVDSLGWLHGIPIHLLFNYLFLLF